MKWQDLIGDGFSRVLEVLEPALKGLKKEDLELQPKPDCNSIGWIVWHLTRGQDAQIADLNKEEQVWVRDKWYVKFQRDSNPGDTGFGHSSKEVADFRSPTARILLDYYRATMERTNEYLSTLNLKDLDKELNEPWFSPPPTLGVRIVSILADCLEHAGEVAYLRGLLKGKGWLDA